MGGLRFFSALLLSALLAGCAAAPRLSVHSQTRLQRGLVIVLPGIEGPGVISRQIRRGLVRGGVEGEVTVLDWGLPLGLLGMIHNQTDILRNRQSADRVAMEIVRYKRSYPGRPVYLVGHSGGAAMAVFVAESPLLTGPNRLDGVVLLSASLSASYDLTHALGNSRRGILSYYNPEDIALLEFGTTIFGNLDGGRFPSGGRVGFSAPRPCSTPQRQDACSRLYQIPMTAEYVYDDSQEHLKTASPHFVQAHVARWIIGEQWPS